MIIKSTSDYNLTFDAVPKTSTFFRKRSAQNQIIFTFTLKNIGNDIKNVNVDITFSSNIKRTVKETLCYELLNIESGTKIIRKATIDFSDPYLDIKCILTDENRTIITDQLDLSQSAQYKNWKHVMSIKRQTSLGFGNFIEQLGKWEFHPLILIKSTPNIREFDGIIKNFYFGGDIDPQVMVEINGKGNAKETKYQITVYLNSKPDNRSNNIGSKIMNDFISWFDVQNYDTVTQRCINCSSSNVTIDEQNSQVECKDCGEKLIFFNRNTLSSKLSKLKQFKPIVIDEQMDLPSKNIIQEENILTYSNLKDFLKNMYDIVHENKYLIKLQIIGFEEYSVNLNREDFQIQISTNLENFLLNLKLPNFRPKNESFMIDSLEEIFELVWAWKEIEIKIEEVKESNYTVTKLNAKSYVIQNIIEGMDNRLYMNFIDWKPNKIPIFQIQPNNESIYDTIINWITNEETSLLNLIDTIAFELIE